MAASVVIHAGKTQRESRAPPFLALRPEITAHPARQVAADREAQPGAFRPPRVAVVDLNERLEHVLEAIRRDPDPGVTHVEIDHVGGRWVEGGAD